MYAAKKTPEEQYRLVLECRQSGLSDCDWCRKNGMNPNTFYTWISRLRKKACYAIPKPSAALPSPDNRPVPEIVKVDILPEDPHCKPVEQENTFIPVKVAQNAIPSIEIVADGITFRFSGPVDASLYEKTLLMRGGRL
ncbi:MAG: transposase [Eubacteriales bacterium]|nr:transposase [Eubacteriales bacterium]